MLDCREILHWIIELKTVAIVTVLTTVWCLLQSPWLESWLSLCHAVPAYSGEQKEHTMLEYVPKWLGRSQSCPVTLNMGRGVPDCWAAFAVRVCVLSVAF